MKNPVIILVVIVALAVLGFGTYMFSQNSKSQSMTKEVENMKPEERDVMEQKSENDEEVMKKDEMEIDNAKMADIRYIEYDKESFDRTADSRRVLFFYASWCPVCQPADMDFATNSIKIPSDMTVIRVNYNDNNTDQDEKDLAKKYGITYQHTFVQIDSQGNEVTKWNGGEVDELLSNIK